MIKPSPRRRPPYPPDTLAKGWRFELDTERIVDRSGTWTLAPAEVRPWLLMLWMTAWRQAPAGSFENDDALIAARIGASLEFFEKHRAILMRGWWLATDGRLYHETITLRVLEMVKKRESDAIRAARSRANKKESDASPDEVTRDASVTRKRPTSEFGTRTRTRRNTPLSPPAGGAVANAKETQAQAKADAARFAAEDPRAIAAGIAAAKALAGMKPKTEPAEETHVDA